MGHLGSRWQDMKRSVPNESYMPALGKRVDPVYGFTTNAQGVKLMSERIN